MTTPSIYIADLAAYNNGILHGTWIDATQDIDDIQAHINSLLSISPIDDAEEYAIHDHEGFEGINIHEYDSIEHIAKLAQFIEEHGALGAQLYNYFDDIYEAIKALDECYHGCYDSLADYAQELTESTTQIPDHLQYYIDYERMARDWDLSGDIFTITTAHDEVHVFSHG